jgi:hypothetical protein
MTLLIPYILSELISGDNFMNKPLIVCCWQSPSSRRAQLQTVQTPPAPKADVDRRYLEDIEDRSEDIANGLLELSVIVRDYNARRIAEFFAEPALTTPLPAAPTAQTPEVKWVQKHGWQFEPKKTASISRAEIVKQWDAFLSNFAEIENVRFKLRAADFGEKARYINKGDHFTDEARECGVLVPGNGMGVAFSDYNNDDLLDIHSTNMSSIAGNRILARLFPNQGAKDNVYKKLAAGNNLFENLGDGRYRNVTAEVGGFSGGWARAAVSLISTATAGKTFSRRTDLFPASQ